MELLLPRLLLPPPLLPASLAAAVPGPVPVPSVSPPPLTPIPPPPPPLLLLPLLVRLAAALAGVLAGLLAGAVVAVPTLLELFCVDPEKILLMPLDTLFETLSATDMLPLPPPPRRAWPPPPPPPPLDPELDRVSNPDSDIDPLEGRRFLGDRLPSLVLPAFPVASQAAGMLGRL